jgi:prevent-host-death family protein
MRTFTIQEAEAHFSELAEQVCLGGEIVLTKDSLPVARLVGLKAQKPEKPGSSVF